jgi:hypothetical protein
LVDVSLLVGSTKAVKIVCRVVASIQWRSEEVASLAKAGFLVFSGGMA